MESRGRLLRNNRSSSRQITINCDRWQGNPARPTRKRNRHAKNSPRPLVKTELLSDEGMQAAGACLSVRAAHDKGENRACFGL